MVLHTLNGSPSQPAFAQCLRVLGADDALLLLGDGVYSVMPGSEALSKLRASGAELFVLGPDALAAGLAGALPDDVRRVDYDGFVELSERFRRQQAWY